MNICPLSNPFSFPLQYFLSTIMSSSYANTLTIMYISPYVLQIIYAYELIMSRLTLECFKCFSHLKPSVEKADALSY